MPDQTPQEQRAYDRGVAVARAEKRIGDAEARLDAINSSIDRSANEAARSADEAAKLRKCVEDLIKEQETRDRIADARAKDAKAAADKQVTTRTFLLGCGGLALVVVGLFLGAA